MNPTPNSCGSGKLGLVVIGRNEGERLARCLASVRGVPRRIYIDSGSTDASTALARQEGIKVVELTTPPHFSAARARNAGIAQLLADDPDLEFIQMVDGDCEVQPGWIDSAIAVLRSEPDLALVFGRLRERCPAKSIYNTLSDQEWNVPVGDTKFVGGNALFRVAAFRDVGVYRPGMLAGEELDLAYRLRKRGWRLRVIAAEMAVHDADMTRFVQWWSRARRSGYGCAELARLHPDSPDWARAKRRILIWSCAIPGLLIVMIVLAVLADARWWLGAASVLLLWPLNVARLTWGKMRDGLSAHIAAVSALLLMVCKLPELMGMISYYGDRLSGRARRLIEYKGNPLS